ncbi:hypothetical protein BDK51DRAFT_39347 [Blyttiomyces helicus]|uniref:Uncharacterized protein n=1 Tax=Blyttiomyces helicus TaxID=388810 RepID=A0A4P9W5K1_9FUNG|nr:hypothetical protein BDK51DRAFT_39347 [Blyttiomyces helicus]|eukprot:RKO87689.1 hypothetical protein BDK51DRAFT_39347 [Blyttiomyces helicus]
MGPLHPVSAASFQNTPHLQQTRIWGTLPQHPPRQIAGVDPPSIRLLRSGILAEGPLSTPLPPQRAYPTHLPFDTATDPAHNSLTCLVETCGNATLQLTLPLIVNYGLAWNSRHRAMIMNMHLPNTTELPTLRLDIHLAQTTGSMHNHPGESRDRALFSTHLAGLVKVGQNIAKQQEEHSIQQMETIQQDHWAACCAGSLTEAGNGNGEDASQGRGKDEGSIQISCLSTNWGVRPIKGCRINCLSGNGTPV